MTDFLQNCIDGVMIGSSYSLLALGFTIIFGVMRRLNLSFGPTIMLGAFGGAWLYLHFNINPWLVLLACIVFTVAVGVYVERLCFNAIKRNVAVTSMVSSFVIWMQLEEIAIHILPGRTSPFPPLFASLGFEAGPFYVRSEYLFMFVVAAISVFAVDRILHRTWFGLQLRAVAEDPRATAYMGINAGRVSVYAFVLVSVLGAVAGYLILAADQQVTPFFGLWATFKGLIAMMLGGMGSLPGAIIGGLLLGVIETQSLWYFGNEYKDLAAYLVLFLMLIARPGGIMGQRLVERRRLAFRRV